MAVADTPFAPFPARPPLEGDYTREELALAYRNSALPLEALAFYVTPVGLHYTLTHFDIPRLDAEAYRLVVGGRVAHALSLTLDEIRALPESVPGMSKPSKEETRRYIDDFYSAIKTPKDVKGLFVSCSPKPTM